MRLAYAQGLLSQKSINGFQRWALMYYFRYESDTEREKYEADLKARTYIDNPRRYVELFAKPLDELMRDEDSEPIDPSEIPDIDTWLSSLDKERVGRPIGPASDSDEGWL